MYGITASRCKYDILEQLKKNPEYLMFYPERLPTIFIDQKFIIMLNKGLVICFTLTSGYIKRHIQN